MSSTAAPKFAKVLQPIQRAGRTAWLYEWDNGEISTIFIPEGFGFDPAKSVNFQPDISKSVG